MNIKIATIFLSGLGLIALSGCAEEVAPKSDRYTVPADSVAQPQAGQPNGPGIPGTNAANPGNFPPSSPNGGNTAGVPGRR